MSHVRARIAAMRGYVPGKQPASLEVVKLNTNENPYPPAPAVMQALASLPAEALRRYPEPLADTFRTLAGRVHGLGPDHVMAVNGGDELLRLCFTTFVDPEQTAAILEPSYSLYPVLAEVQGARLLQVDATDEFGVPEGFAERLNREGTRLTLLVNPHAPSGRLLSAASVSRLAEALEGVLLMDEAYVDFVDPDLGHNLVPLLEKHDNLMLLRTLSKGYSLAGLRFGYALGNPSLIEPMLYKTRDSYNVDAVAQHLACAALSHPEVAQQSWARVRSERERLRAALAGLGLSAPESQTNFLLAREPEGGPTARSLFEGLEARGVWVRHFTQPRVDRYLRITIGTPEQNDRLLVALRELL